MSCDEKCKCRCEGCLYIQSFPDMPPLDPPNIVDYVNGTKKEWVVACNWLGPWLNGKAVLFKKGFTTDGASIPNFTKSFIGDSFQLPLLPFALCHDGVYCAELLTRKECDEWFYELMRMNGYINVAKAQIIYQSVRKFGQPTWNRHTKESITLARSYVKLITSKEEYDRYMTTRIIDF